MNRAEEAIDLIYEDEEMAICCGEVLSAIEKLLTQLDKTLPFYVNSDFFIELVDKIKNELLSGNKTLEKKLLEGKMGVVTVTFELGSLGLDVARAIGGKLGYRVVFGEILAEAARRLGVPEWEIEDFNEFKYVPSKLSLFDLFQLDRSFIDFSAILGGGGKEEITFEQFREALVKTITAFAVSNNIVIVGHAAACILREYPNSLHIKVEAPFLDRVKVYAERTGVSLDGAEKQLRKIDEKEKEFYKDLCDTDITRIDLFHLKLNTSRLSVEKATELALKAFELVVD
jgi:cytidylate kinase